MTFKYNSMGAVFLSLAIVLLPTQVVAIDVHNATLHANQPQAPITLGLDDAIHLAIRNNRGIRTAYLQRIAQKFDLYVSEGKFLPKLTLTSGLLDNKANGQPSRTKNITTNTTLDLPTGAKLSLATTNGLGSSSANLSTTSLTLTQPLLKNGGLDANTTSVRIARIDEKISQLNLKSTISQTVMRVIFSFRDLIKAQEQQKIAEVALQRSKELYRINKALIFAGRMADVEIYQTEAEIANRELALEEASNQKESSRLALLNLLALEAQTPIFAVGGNDIIFREVDLNEALNTAFESQPDYLIAQLQSERAKINLDYARNQQLWDLSLVVGKTQSRGSSGDFGQNYATQTSNQKNDTSYAGVQITIPIGDRSIKQATVHAYVDFKNQALMVNEKKQIIEQSIRDAVRNVKTRWRQLELSNKTLELSLLKLNSEREKLQAGRSSNFQILSFENDLRNAENSRVNAEISYLNSLTDLDERMGRTLEIWKIPVSESESESELSNHEY